MINQYTRCQNYLFNIVLITSNVVVKIV